MKTLSYDEINKLSLQEACDYAVAKIVEQGVQCVDGWDQCVYGNDKGQHCAIGWLLNPDDKEISNFMGEAFSADVEVLAEEVREHLPAVVTHNLAIMKTLQQFHDTNRGVIRRYLLESLAANIDVDSPQYNEWVEMGG